MQKAMREDCEMTVTQDAVRQLLDYDQESGELKWTGAARNQPKGQRAGGVGVRGYRLISILGKRYPEHRVIFLWMTGKFPAFDVDHVNRDKADNRWENLRPATRAENLHNLGRRSGNTSGKRGVWWHAKSSRWTAQIRVNGRRVHLGLFESVDQASDAYEAAAIRHFGAFALERQNGGVR
jgi:hypothetical protein